VTDTASDEDVTMDMALPFPTRKSKAALKKPVPLKERTPEEVREMCARAREVGPLLAEKLDALNAALLRVQDRFTKGLGETARGRVVLLRNPDGFIEHLVFQDGKILYESGYPGEVVASPLVKASKRVRLLATGKLKELWTACGGPSV
jgi:hypothetical protein